MTSRAFLPIWHLPIFHLWVYLETQPLLGLTLTLAAYQLGALIDRRAGHKAFTNPTVFAIAVLACGLLITRTPYSDYFAGAQYVHFLLGPATVALAVPMYANRDAMRRNAFPILIALGAGSLVACLSAMLIARALGAPGVIVIALAPKSVTTPIAMGIAQNLGGSPALTAVFVLLTGMFGAMVCLPALRLLRVRDPRAQGLAGGTAAHGLATARLLMKNETAGAFGGLAIGVNGIVTALLVPLLVHWLGIHAGGP